MPRTKTANRGRQSAYLKLEAKLLEWITDRWQQGIGASVIKVQADSRSDGAAVDIQSILRMGA